MLVKKSTALSCNRFDLKSMLLFLEKLYGLLEHFYIIIDIGQL